MIKILYLQYINRQAVWLNYDIVLYLVVCTVLNFLLICNVHSGNHSCNWWYLEIIYLFLFICLVNCYLYNYLCGIIYRYGTILSLGVAFYEDCFLFTLGEFLDMFFSTEHFMKLVVLGGGAKDSTCSIFCSVSTCSLIRCLHQNNFLLWCNHLWFQMKDRKF